MAFIFYWIKQAWMSCIYPVKAFATAVQMLFIIIPAYFHVWKERFCWWKLKTQLMKDKSVSTIARSLNCFPDVVFCTVAKDAKRAQIMTFKRRRRRPKKEPEADTVFIMLPVLMLMFIAGIKLAVQRNVNKRVSQLWPVGGPVIKIFHCETEMWRRY